ncbi:pyroglutamyl-peptidase 1-like protein isoform 3-T4 [Ara ararauna]
MQTSQLEEKKVPQLKTFATDYNNYNTVGTERQQDFTFWSTDFMESNSSAVVVTGFGPFRQYLVNSSWEAVKELSKRGLGNNIDLRIMQLPVAYQKAKEQVFKIWTTLQPLVHLRLHLLRFSVLRQWKSSFHPCASIIPISNSRLSRKSITEHYIRNAETVWGGDRVRWITEGKNPEISPGKQKPIPQASRKKDNRET